MAGKFFKIPFATSGDRTAIPDAVQPSGEVSFTEGFTFDYERDNADPDYKPVPRNETNSLYFEITEALGIMQRQGVSDWFDPAVTLTNYPINATVRHINQFWLSTVANNSSTPGANADWVSINTLLSAATETNRGTVELATSAETIAGLSSALGVHPAGLLAALTAYNMPSTVGLSRNSRMRTGAIPTGTYAADEIIVGTSVGGALRRLSGVSESINLGTTGAGGMDVGSPPVNGFVALYVIFNPTTSDVALLATNCTSVAPTETYTKANMPAGYTYSALAAVLRVASSAFVSQVMRGRSVSQDPVVVLSSSTTRRATPFALNIASAVPLNAISCGGSIGINGSGAGPDLLVAVGSAVNMEGQQQATLNGSQSNPAISISFSNLLTLPATPQSIHYLAVSSAGAIVVNININGYEF